MRGHSPLSITLPCCSHFSSLALAFRKAGERGRGVHRVINLGPTPTICLAWETLGGENSGLVCV